MWPQDNIMCQSANLITEELKTKDKLRNVISNEKLSDYDKVIRVLCYIPRFIYNCKAIVRKEICLTGNVIVLENSKKQLLEGF